MRKRGFEVISEYENKDINLPTRQTKHSVGYDFQAVIDITIPSLPQQLVKEFGKAIFSDGDIKKAIKNLKPTLVPTGIKSYMKENEGLFIYNRSSNPLKKGLILSNGVGIIDPDYYDNQNNEGHIYGQFYNFLPFDIEIKKGDRIMQGVFKEFLKTDDDNAHGEREGGHGSTK